MRIKAVLIDFDGTLVDRSMLDWLCEMVGKEKESRQIGIDHLKGLSKGLYPLTQRINLLNGLLIANIKRKLDKNNFLREGAEEFFDFLHSNNIISILHSGNILPLLKYYQTKLKIDYIIGSNPTVKDNKIINIKIDSYNGSNYKLFDVKKILKNLKIKAKETVALGDSPSDKEIFKFAHKSIAVNPRFGIEKYADYIVKNNLREAVGILEDLMKKNK